MIIIPITNDTLDMIEILNHGVRPELEGFSTYFVFKGKDEPGDIINRTKVEIIIPNMFELTKIFHVSDHHKHLL